MVAFLSGKLISIASQFDDPHLQYVWPQSDVCESGLLGSIQQEVVKGGVQKGWGL